MGSYSQGAVVMHHAAAKLSLEILARAIANITLGDGGQLSTSMYPSLSRFLSLPTSSTEANLVCSNPVRPIPRWPDVLE